MSVGPVFSSPIALLLDFSIVFSWNVERSPCFTISRLFHYKIHVAKKVLGSTSMSSQQTLLPLQIQNITICNKGNDLENVAPSQWIFMQIYTFENTILKTW